MNHDTRVVNKRNLHPSVFKKIRITKELIKKGVNKKQFIEKGGLDLETFNTLNLKRKKENNLIREYEKELVTKYGSLKAASHVKGPCKKIEPVIGNKNALVLLTEFNDVKHSYDSNHFQNLLFSKGGNNSMRDYYLETSDNQLDINGTVYDRWFEAASDVNYYIDKKPVKGDFPHSQELVRETISQAIKNGIDFKPFAPNGKIELLIIIYAGKGMDTKLNVKYIWPHQDRLNEPIEVQKGIWADRYCIVSEYPADDLGCFCHEVSHLLGLPDLYNNYGPMVGYWCLMGAGGYVEDGKRPSHLSAWCKLQLGWQEPVIIYELPSKQEIPSITDETGVIYKLEVEGTGGREYFLLENRQKKGFDSGLPHSGLLIWHVNENNCVNLQPNSNPDKLFLRLIQSDGRNELQRDRTATIQEEGLETAIKDLGGDEGDPYPGITVNRNFNHQSHPNSNSDSGAKSMISVTSISNSGEKMEAHIGVEEKEDADTHKTGKTSSNDYTQFIKYLIKLMNSPDQRTTYEEGYEAGREDSVMKLKEKLGLSSYADGYLQGFFEGYKKARKKKK